MRRHPRGGELAEHGGALEGAPRGLRVGRGDAKLALEVRQADAVEAAADAAFKAVARTSGVADGFVVAGWGVACTGGGLKVAEGVAGRGGEDRGEAA